MDPRYYSRPPVLRFWSLLALVLLPSCVPEDPPEFRRDLSGARPASTRSKSSAKTRDAGRRDPALPKVVTEGEGAAAHREAIRAPFRDAFEREELGPDWKPTSPAWRMDRGAVCVRGARNRPLWLSRKLPANARIEFDATSHSPEGDIKVEAWGDGKTFATSTSYSNATSYILVFGGWKNSLHVLARLDEHKSDRLALKVDPNSDDPRQHPVSEGQTYHFKIERSDDTTVRWFVDDVELHVFEDEDPLLGPGHEHFGFNNWEVPVCFDNLNIAPLEG